MFKNRHLQVKVVPDGEESDCDHVPHPFLLDVDMILENHLNSIIGGAVTIMVARKVLNTACDLVLIRAGR